MDVAQGLFYLHSHSVLHLDIKASAQRQRRANSPGGMPLSRSVVEHRVDQVSSGDLSSLDLPRLMLHAVTNAMRRAPMCC